MERITDYKTLGDVMRDNRRLRRQNEEKAKEIEEMAKEKEKKYRSIVLNLKSIGHSIAETATITGLDSAKVTAIYAME